MVYSRPNIMFTIDKLAQFIDEPNALHIHNIKILLQYLRETIDLNIRYGPHKESNNQMIEYSDADYANNKYNRKSVSGIIFILNNSSIS
jgi:hypothetical protein